MKSPARKAMTIVELLIVIVIIAILFQLTLPAIESAQESARQTNCKNNIRQLALGCQMHVSAHGIYPTGGWTYAWVGDPDRGFTKKQPGSWCYNILPYIEEQALHDLAAGLTAKDHRKATAQMYATVVPLFVCTSRRAARPQPFYVPMRIMNASLADLKRMNKAGRSDYAANMGTNLVEKSNLAGPSSYKQGDKWEIGTDPNNSWTASENNGVIFQRSEVKPAMVTDGLSHTFLLGEKFSPLGAKYGQSTGDDQSLYVGFDFDNNRAGNVEQPPIRDNDVKFVEDYKMYWRFGSAHPTGFHMARCDGSVDRVDYSVDMKIFSAMCTRDQGEGVDLSN